MMYKKCDFIHPKEYNWHEISALVLSPGVPTEPHWIVKLARRFDCKIKSDIELFLEAKTTNQKVIGITGTNGKSTTTSLIGYVLKSAGKKVAIGGNLGVPVLDLERDAEIYVIEFSSFQLELMNEINVDISALLNITPDHIDRHGSMENYIATKLKLINGRLRHRNELLGKIRNVFFVNDSKATNAKSSEKAVLSYENINWIVGGRSKKGGIESLSKHFTRIRKAFLIGESTEAFANTMENKVDFVKCCNLKNALKLAFEEALNSAEENGIYSALEHIAEDLNSSMEAELRNSNLEDMKVRERVKLAIQIRLSNYAKLPNYRELLKNVLSFSVSPKNTYFSKLLAQFGMAFMINQQILTTIQKEQY
uniref:Mur ligase central domain-containing protein n=1 Tax=Glossina austeni TaxID=7395 RepID=A0A1A9VJU6_GLOAU